MYKPLYKQAMLEIVDIFKGANGILEKKDIYKTLPQYTERTINLALKTLKQYGVLETHLGEKYWEISLQMEITSQSDEKGV
jgi:hypothetical protein